jgi:hypothetical protein
MGQNLYEFPSGRTQELELHPLRGKVPHKLEHAISEVKIRKAPQKLQEVVTRHKNLSTVPVILENSVPKPLRRKLQPSTRDRPLPSVSMPSVPPNPSQAPSPAPIVNCKSCRRPFEGAAPLEFCKKGCQTAEVARLGKVARGCDGDERRKVQIEVRRLERRALHP